MSGQTVLWRLWRTDPEPLGHHGTTMERWQILSKVTTSNSFHLKMFDSHCRCMRLTSWSLVFIEPPKVMAAPHAEMKVMPC